MSEARDRGGRTLAVIGAGGNIGSHLVPHLARMPGVRAITLVDPDVYAARNLASQDVRRRDLGRPKALVQGRRVREIDPTLAVRAVAEAVETVPLGCLRADVLLACVDSRAARRSINTLATRLDTPWIDAGVLADGLLARVNVYLPGAPHPCIECAWDARDYEGLEQAYPCAGDDVPAPTNAPSSLGALAAALQAIECRKLLAGDWEHLAADRQVTVSALAARHHVTRFARRATCRFDHEVWAIERLEEPPSALTVAGLLDRGRRALAVGGEVRLKVAEQVFARRLSCATCGARRELGPYLFARLGAAERACDRCGTAMRVAGFDVVEWLAAADLPRGGGDTSCRSLGLRAGDVVSVAGDGGAVHLEIGGDA